MRWRPLVSSTSFVYCLHCLYRWGDACTCGASMYKPPRHVDVLVLASQLVGRGAQCDRQMLLRSMTDTLVLDLYHKIVAPVGTTGIVLFNEVRLQHKRTVDVSAWLGTTTKILVLGQDWWPVIDKSAKQTKRVPGHHHGKVLFGKQAVWHGVYVYDQMVGGSVVEATERAMNEFVHEYEYFRQSDRRASGPAGAHEEQTS